MCVFCESMTRLHIGPGKFIWPFRRRIYHFEQCGRRSRTWRRGAKHSDQAQTKAVNAAPPEWWVLRLTISERGPSAKLRQLTWELGTFATAGINRRRTDRNSRVDRTVAKTCPDSDHLSYSFSLQNCMSKKLVQDALESTAP